MKQVKRIEWISSVVDVAIMSVAISRDSSLEYSRLPQNHPSLRSLTCVRLASSAHGLQLGFQRFYRTVFDAGDQNLGGLEQPLVAAPVADGLDLREVGTDDEPLPGSQIGDELHHGSQIVRLGVAADELSVQEVLLDRVCEVKCRIELVGVALCCVVLCRLTYLAPF